MKEIKPMDEDTFNKAMYVLERLRLAILEAAETIEKSKFHK